MCRRCLPTSSQRPANLTAQDPVTFSICIMFAPLLFHSDGALACIIDLSSDIVRCPPSWNFHALTQNDQHHSCDNLYEKNRPCHCIFLLAKPTRALQAMEVVILALGKLHEM